MGKSRYTQTQTLILSKKRFGSVEDATRWIHEHGFADIPDETGTSYRFRQRDPDFFKSNSFRTIELAEGVKAITAIPRTRKER